MKMKINKEKNVLITGYNGGLVTTVEKYYYLQDMAKNGL